MRSFTKKPTAALTALALALGLTACGAQEAPELMDPTVTVETTAATQGDLTLEETYVASITAEGTANVYPRVTGVVEEIRVSSGDTVSAGDVLCRFADADTAAISQSQARLNYETAAAAKHPKAEIAGTISEVYVKNGDTVSAGTALMKIVASTDILADFLFTFADPASFYAGQSATVFINGFAGSVQGTVVSVSNATTVTSNAKEACSVRVKVANPGTLTDSGSYTAQAVIGSYTSYGNAPLSLTGANTVYAAGGGTVSGLDKLAGSTVSAGETLCTLSSDALDAQIESARLSLQSAGTAVENYTLTSPISGVVEAVNVTEHDMASAGAAAFVIAASADKTATFYVTDTVAAAMAVGQEVTAESQGVSYTGSVSEIGLSVDPATGLFKVKATLQNAESLPNGATVSLRTAAAEEEGAVIVPSDALYFDDGGATYLYVVEGDIARRREVTLGIYSGEQAAITAGLAAGEEIVTTWSAGLRDGAPVRRAETPGSAPVETEA